MKQSMHRPPFETNVHHWLHEAPFLTLHETHHYILQVIILITVVQSLNLTPIFLYHGSATHVIIISSIVLLDYKNPFPFSETGMLANSPMSC